MLTDIAAAVVWVDFATIVLHKIFGLGKSLDKWYAQFGVLAVISDCLVIVLGILLAKMFLPQFPLVYSAVAIQIIHDLLFYQFVVIPTPRGHNQIIDLFKEYATENAWKIVAYDSLMVASTVLLAQQFASMKKSNVSFLGLLGAYALTYIIYTK
jgi:uncharacterized protein YacL